MWLLGRIWYDPSSADLDQHSFSKDCDTDQLEFSLKMVKIDHNKKIQLLTTM